MSVLNALKWSFFGELASKAIQPVVFIILARLLTPEDFGVMTAVLMVIGFSQIIWEAGMGKALIQRQTEIYKALNVAFWINVMLGICIAVGLFFVAGFVAKTFFQDDRVEFVLKIMTLQILFGSVSSVHSALLMKTMDFKRLFWIRFASVSLPGLASIPLAWQGMSYWALVTGSLIGQFGQVVMLWSASSWRPQFVFDIKIAKELWRFSYWVTLSGLMSWFYIWADSLIVGVYLSSKELGLYRIGSQVPSMLFSLLFSPILPVLYSFLSKKSDIDFVKIYVVDIMRVLTIASFSLLVVLLFLQSSIEFLFFNEEWRGVGFVIAIMSIVNGFGWIVGMNGDIYRSVGRPHYDVFVNASVLFVYIIVYYVSVQNGFVIFLYARALLSLIAFYLHVLLMKKVFQVSILRTLSYIFKILFIYLLFAYVADFISKYTIDSILFQVVCFLSVFLSMNIVYIYCFECNNSIIKNIKLKFI